MRHETTSKVYQTPSPMTEWITPAEAKARGYDSMEVARIQRKHEARSEALELISEIQKAFCGVPRPKVTLSVARGYDDEWVLSEKRITELQSLDQEQTWEEVADAAMESQQEYFTFSDAEGWRFYLPAYLCHALREFPESHWPAIENACESQRDMDLLNEEQMKCIVQFLALREKYESL
jgi:hypothetical protein